MADGLRVHGVKDKTFIEARVERSLQQAALLQEVKDRLDQSALGLSGGRQRLCPAGALAVEAEVILPDEAAPALDPSVTREIEEWIHHLKPDYTVVIVPHNMQQAARVSDVTAFFPMGKPVEANTTGTLFTRPKHR